MSSAPRTRPTLPHLRLRVQRCVRLQRSPAALRDCLAADAGALQQLAPHVIQPRVKDVGLGAQARAQQGEHVRRAVPARSHGCGCACMRVRCAGLCATRVPARTVTRTHLKACISCRYASRSRSSFRVAVTACCGHTGGTRVQRTHICAKAAWCTQPEHQHKQPSGLVHWQGAARCHSRQAKARGARVADLHGARAARPGLPGLLGCCLQQREGLQRAGAGGRGRRGALGRRGDGGGHKVAAGRAT